MVAWSPITSATGTHQPTPRTNDGWVDGWMGGWVDGWMGGWVDGWMGGWVDGWMDGWMGGWKMDGWSNTAAGFGIRLVPGRELHAEVLGPGLKAVDTLRMHRVADEELVLRLDCGEHAWCVLVEGTLSKETVP